jgi:hypothetical protein
MTRILDLARDELVTLRGRALTESVAAAEGRTIAAEVIVGGQGLIDGIENAELVAALGADLVILNFVEMAWSGTTWRFPTLGALADLRSLARIVGRPIGVNLEPGRVPDQRRATAGNARALIDAGAAMLCLTANPGTDTGFDDLARVTTALRAELGDDAALWVGKMHQAGHAEPITREALTRLVDAGADGVLIPLPGTVPGVTRELAVDLCAAVHDSGAIVMGTIGTSQEGARPQTIAQLGLLAKEIGVDVHHLGDAGLGRVTDPDAVYEYSIAIRGRRHTWRRMALGARQSARLADGADVAQR